MFLLERNLILCKGQFYAVTSVWRYLEHVRVVVMAVLHHHRLVPRQSEGDAVLAAAVDGLQQQQQQQLIFTRSGTFFNHSDVPQS